MAEAFKRPPEIAAIATSDLGENAAEKFVALTRRAGAQLAGLREKRNPTLVRHIYDLHLLEKHLDAADVASLIAVIMQEDAETRGNLFPAYQQDPLRETLRAVEGILGEFDTQFARRRREQRRKSGVWAHRHDQKRGFKMFRLCSTIGNHDES